MARASAPPYPLPSAVSDTLATSQASVLPLCLVRATIFAMFDAPTMTSLHPQAQRLEGHCHALFQAAQ